jgi:hypothetical protein
VSVLPVLIADSVHINGNTYAEAGRRLEQVERTFWKAIACRGASK